jgi:hypothetical protein
VLALDVVVAWLAILVLAVLNRTLRERVLVPALRPVAGLGASGLLLSALVVVAAFVAVPRFGPPESRRDLVIGVAGLLMTLAFEFAFGLSRRTPWPVLLEAYTFKGGNLWPLVVLVTRLAPSIARVCAA